MRCDGVSNGGGGTQSSTPLYLWSFLGDMRVGALQALEYLAAYFMHSPPFFNLRRTSVDHEEIAANPSICMQYGGITGAPS